MHCSKRSPSGWEEHGAGPTAGWPEGRGAGVLTLQEPLLDPGVGTECRASQAPMGLAPL